MTDTVPETEATFDNPLIPNARLRQIYLAMVRMNLLEKRLEKRRKPNTARGLEACLVSTSVDLGPGDLVSDTVAGGVVEFLRGTTLERVLQPSYGKKKRGFKADCGWAAVLPTAPGIAERMWAALGAAAALKADHVRERAVLKELAKPASVVLLYVRVGEAPAALWREALTFAAVEELPLLFVVMPPVDRTKAKTVATIGTLAIEHGIPGIPVDAEDAVAIYRVAQEAIGRARIGGGAALLECIPFMPETKGKGASSIATLEQYMLGRRVVTKSWMEREAKTFAKRLSR